MGDLGGHGLGHGSTMTSFSRTRRILSVLVIVSDGHTCRHMHVAIPGSEEKGRPASEPCTEGCQGLFLKGGSLTMGPRGLHSPLPRMAQTRFCPRPPLPPVKMYCSNTLYTLQLTMMASRDNRYILIILSTLMPIIEKTARALGTGLGASDWVHLPS